MIYHYAVMQAVARESINARLAAAEAERLASRARRHRFHRPQWWPVRLRWQRATRPATIQSPS
jgi:hypothetical protein